VKKNRTRSLIIAARTLSIVLLVILFFSCLSFNIGDWPSTYTSPNNNPPKNWCGSAGAFCAYHLLYFIGPGVFILLIYAVWLLALKFANKHIAQPILRTIGAVLLAMAISSTFFWLWPAKVFEFPIGSGGLVGVGTVTFLKAHFASFGAFLLLLAVWFVAGLLVADDLVVMVMQYIGLGFVKGLGMVVPAWETAIEHSENVKDIWHRLSLKQKKLSPQEQLMASLNKVKQPPAVALNNPDGIGIKEIKADQKTIRLQSVRMEKLNPLQPSQMDAERLRKSDVQPAFDDYTLPPLELLSEPQFSFSELQGKVVKSKAAALEKLLAEFDINAQVVAADTGPVVTMFELELAPGIKVSQISSLSNDVARALSAGAVRVVAPLPGKHTIGIEVPNLEKERVRMKDIIRLAANKPDDMQIPLFLGKDSAGEALVSDLASMPHLLIAGTTGSGKSVCINSIITSILLTKRPDEVKLILIDPKMVEMTAFNTIPHLMCPIVTETNRAVQILEWATVKMDERYALFAEARVKNIAEYNDLGPEEIISRLQPSSADEEAKIPKLLPYIVIVIDELADLMMTAPKEIEAYIVRLAQKSRAIGIHIVLATQRPQATVVTGLIKSNMPTRIGFRVAAKMDSRIILDQNGAEALLGQGDMLFLKPGTSDLIRAQGTYVDEDEVKKIARFLKDIAEPQFHPELTQLNRVDVADMETDELFDEAVRIVLESERGSVSLLQRRLAVGYARASRMIEAMAAMGILGEYKGSQAREVLITIEEYEQMKQRMVSEVESKQQTEPQQVIDDEEPAEEDEPEPVAKPSKSKRHTAPITDGE
jgi:S-DNA-T family DNA segregation ATPase FtsK/SpoIIIE